MVKGCKLSIEIAKDDVASLERGSKIKLELKGYTESEDGSKGYSYQYTPVFDNDVETANTFAWYFKLDAQCKGVNKGDVDIDYGQLWELDGDREKETTDVVDDSEAPKRGFLLDTAFDATELTLNFMVQDTEIYLGSYNKGKWKVTPEITFRVTVTSGRNTDVHEFFFQPRDRSDDKSPYEQIITFHPAMWSQG